MSREKFLREVPGIDDSDKVVVHDGGDARCPRHICFESLFCNKLLMQIRSSRYAKARF